MQILSKLKLIREEKLIKIYKSIQNRNEYRQKPAEIILFKQPERILETPHGGHAEVRRTDVRLKQKYIWKNIYKMIKDFISHCESCKKNKVVRHWKTPMQITNAPTTPFQFIQLDTVAPLRVSNG